MIKQVETDYVPQELERQVQEFWARTKAYEKTRRLRSTGRPYYFIDGPPYTTGSIHLGTALNKTLKDVVLRYRRMRGYQVRDQPGFDMHGLPIEVQVERTLGIVSKKDIEELGVEKFVSTCREFAEGYAAKMAEQFAGLGVWLDWKNPYVTVTNGYVEAAWWTLKRAEERGLLTEAERVLPWCPRCETALAEAELEYWDETDPSVFVKFPLHGRPHEYVLVWTTTPWTLPANLAVAVHPDLGYVKMRYARHGRLEAVWTMERSAEAVLALAGRTGPREFRLPSLTEGAREGMLNSWAVKEGDWVEKEAPLFTVETKDVVVEVTAPEPVYVMRLLVPAGQTVRVGEPVLVVSDYQKEEQVPGSAMVGWDTVHPLASKVPYHATFQGEWVRKVLPFAEVAAEQSGVVHIAPGHGPADFDLGQKHGLPPFSPVDERGRYTVQAGEFVGKHVREANAEIIDVLRASDLLYSAGDVTHRYAHCWRCQTPIIYRTTTQWFLKVPELRQKMLAEIEKVRWTPEWAGSSRQYDWVVNARDWCLSRQRYWGIPMPIWRCANCAHRKVVGSLAELRDGRGYEEGMDLHRPAVDAIVLPCPKCKGDMRRTLDVLDVWFDSGVCAWAQLGYPLEKEEYQKWFPAKWICEAHDQTRGWFYSQLAAGLVAFDRAPYESVLMHGWVNDAQGQPMSKSVGNVVEPSEVIEKYGIDALRLYLLRTNAPWEDMAFSWDDVKNAHRTLGVLWNVYRFAALYASIDRFEPDAHPLESVMNLLRPEDRWLISRTQRLKATVEEEMERYHLHKAARALETFVTEDLSHWYVRVVRDRTWSEEQGPAKLAAYRALYEALTTVAKLLAPFCPHVAETMYQNLDGRLLTVHMSDWPRADETLLNTRLEKEMQAIQEIVDIVTKVRQKRGVKLRWPVRSIVIKAANDEMREALTTLGEVLRSQVNAKRLDVLRPGQEWEGLKLQVRPSPQAIGRAYKVWTSKIATLLENRPADEVMRDLQEKGEYKIGIEGQVIRIEPTMVSFAKVLPPEVVAVEVPQGDIYIDMEVTPEIRAEGMAREVTRRVQQMRKELDLDVEEFVRATIKASDVFRKDLELWRTHVEEETRVRGLTFTQEDVDEEYVVEWDIEGESVIIGITPLFLRQAVRAFTRIPGLSEEKAMAIFDAGYGSEAALQHASLDELMAIRGIDEVDARRIRTHFEKPPEEVARPSCAACGAAVKPGDNVCGRCQEPLVPGKACPRCEAFVPEGTSRCGQCGLDLAKPAEEARREREEFAAIARIPGLDMGRARALVDAGYTFHKLRNASEEQLTQVSGIDKRVAQLIADHFRAGSTLSCPLCGARVPPGSDHCTRCGNPLPKPEAATGAPKPAPAVQPVATKPAGPAVGDLKDSFTYLILEEQPENSYRLFTEALALGRKGLCVTRVYPDKIRERAGLKEMPILWLSNVGKEDAVRPKDLEKLSLSLEQFLTREGGVVLLDGMEYLITNNNFITVLRLVQSLRDQVSINKAIFLISVNPSTLDSTQITLLEREVDQVIAIDQAR